MPTSITKPITEAPTAVPLQSQPCGALCVALLTSMAVLVVMVAGLVSIILAAVYLRTILSRSVYPCGAEESSLSHYQVAMGGHHQGVRGLGVPSGGLWGYHPRTMGVTSGGYGGHHQGVGGHLMGAMGVTTGGYGDCHQGAMGSPQGAMEVAIRGYGVTIRGLSGSQAGGWGHPRGLGVPSGSYGRVMQGATGSHREGYAAPLVWPFSTSTGVR